MRNASYDALRSKIDRAYGVAALVLLVGLASLGGVLSLLSISGWVAHTRVVLDQVNAYLLTLTDAESAQRGFLITGDDRYLAPGLDARSTLDRIVGDLRALTADNPAQSPRLDSLASIGHRKLDELAETIQLRRTVGFDSAASIVRTDRGRSAMTAARAVVAAIGDDERALLAARERRARRDAQAALAVITIGSAVAFLLAAAVTDSIRRDVDERERARQQLEAQALQLEEQAAELEAQQTELEAQTEALSISNRDLVAANDRAESAIRSQRAALFNLGRSNIELDQFAYVASHDLKAPLRGIANLSSWVEDDLGDAATPGVREHLAMLRGRVHRMEALIDGILQYSRAGRANGAPQPVDVAALVRDVVELLDPPAAATVHVSTALPTLVTERVPLQQVFMNLIGNAIKHAGRPDARITVAAGGSDGTREFTVADNGPGIPAEYHERIFGIFQTLEARDKVEGTGIGLSVVRKIVEARGGRVCVDSTDGTGATFRFTWPDSGPVADAA
jgi:signal transduction histidine kinase